MAIKVPGIRTRNGRKGAGKRSSVVVLSLTAMVDMFTVLAVFLLQNYNATGEILTIDESVKLPTAGAVKELKPSYVVVISEQGISINEEKVAEYAAVKDQDDYTIPSLEEKLMEMIEKGELAKKSIANKIKDAVNNIDGNAKPMIDDFRKVTIQADKKALYGIVRKVMFAVTNAGIYEINFAVIKTARDKQASN